MLGLYAYPVAAETIFESSAKSLATLKEKITVTKLDNGLTIVMYPRGFAPIFSAVTSVGVGGVDEHQGETGIAHMFEHMAFKGTSAIGTKDIAAEKPLLAQIEVLAAKDPTFESLLPQEKEQLQQIYSQLQKLWNKEEFSLQYEKRGSVDLNAQTDKDHTTYMVSLPKNAFEFWAKTESARLQDPILRQFYSERDVVLEERRMRFENDPASMMYEQVLQHAYTIHPYRLPLIGYEDDIRHLTATKLDAFRKQYYVPSNIVISVVGYIDQKADLEVMKKYFGSIPAGAAAPGTKLIEPMQTSERQFVFPADVSPQVSVAYHKPNYPHPDDAVISVLDQMLTGSSQSPLFDILVKKENLATQVNQTEAPGTRFPNLILFNLIPRQPHTNAELLKRFDEVLQQSISTFTDEQLVQAKRAIAVSYLSQMKSNITLAETLSSVQLSYGNWAAIIDWYQEVLKVTKPDLERVAHQYLVPQNRTVGFLEKGADK